MVLTCPSVPVTIDTITFDEQADGNVTIWWYMWTGLNCFFLKQKIGRKLPLFLGPLIPVLYFWWHLLFGLLSVWKRQREKGSAATLDIRSVGVALEINLQGPHSGFKTGTLGLQSDYCVTVWFVSFHLPRSLLTRPRSSDHSINSFFMKTA